MRSREKRVGLLSRFQIGNVAPALFAKSANKDRAPMLLVEERQQRVGQSPKMKPQANPVRYALGKDIPER